MTILVLSKAQHVSGQHVYELLYGQVKNMVAPDSFKIETCFLERAVSNQKFLRF